MKLVFAVSARQDIADIYSYITQQNAAAAQRVEDRIRATCEALRDFPYASIATDELGVRRVPLVRYPYSIYFRVNEASKQVEIIRVIHASLIRDLRRLPG